MNYTDYIADRDRPCAIVAHRGVWRAAPENSLLAIDRAIQAGHDVVEIDVRRSIDGEFFLLHDDTLARMADREQEPEALTASQLAGLRLRDRDGGQANPFTEEKLANLKDVFALTRDRIFIHLDVKHKAIIPEVLACAQSMSVDGQVDFWGDLKTRDDLERIRETIVPSGVLFMAKTRLNVPDAEAQLDLLFELKPSVCEIYFDHLEQVVDRRARFEEAGIALWVNTLDSVSCAGFTDTAALQDPGAIWGRLLDAGISAIQTDEMDALRSYLDTRHGAPTARNPAGRQP